MSTSSTSTALPTSDMLAAQDDLSRALAQAEAMAAHGYADATEAFNAMSPAQHDAYMQCLAERIRDAQDAAARLDAVMKAQREHATEDRAASEQTEPLGRTDVIRLATSVAGAALDSTREEAFGWIEALFYASRKFASGEPIIAARLAEVGEYLCARFADHDARDRERCEAALRDMRAVAGARHAEGVRP